MRLSRPRARARARAARSRKRERDEPPSLDAAAETAATDT
jgi:hypothetical protein